MIPDKTAQVHAATAVAVGDLARWLSRRAPDLYEAAMVRRAAVSA